MTRKGKGKGVPSTDATWWTNLTDFVSRGLPNGRRVSGMSDLPTSWQFNLQLSISGHFDAQERQAAARSISASKESGSAWEYWLQRASVVERELKADALLRMGILIEHDVQIPISWLNEDPYSPFPEQKVFFDDLKRLVLQSSTEINDVPMHGDGDAMPIVPTLVVSINDDGSMSTVDHADAPPSVPAADHISDCKDITALLHMWTTCTRIKRARNTNEATERIVADSLIRYVFDDTEVSSPSDYWEGASGFSVRMEETIALPRSVVNQATVNALVVASLPKSAVDAICDQQLGSRVAGLRLRYRIPESPELHYIGVFPVVDKCKESLAARRHIIMELSAIQHHRKALCLRDRNVYGAVYRDATFYLFVSWWKDHKSIVSESRNVPRDLLKEVHSSTLRQFHAFPIILKERLRSEIVTDFSNIDMNQLFIEEGQKKWTQWRGPAPGTMLPNPPHTDLSAENEEGFDDSTDEEPPEVSNLDLNTIHKVDTIRKVETWRDSVAKRLLTGKGADRTMKEMDRKEEDDTNEPAMNWQTILESEQPLKVVQELQQTQQELLEAQRITNTTQQELLEAQRSSNTIQQGLLEAQRTANTIQRELLAQQKILAGCAIRSESRLFNEKTSSSWMRLPLPSGETLSEKVKFPSCRYDVGRMNEADVDRLLDAYGIQYPGYLLLHHKIESLVIFLSGKSHLDRA
ncbi:hypothetical protein EIP91_003735 [Steccherinum ochraceum]|uniref:Uncharacterized protein n=1 Tax=Steccherinum ochraceum TaxID=92696 RepID=A0A4R0RT33_9APHY|nr:hypothetical protein EIP91_003735 [Steccherinum ochraceum]